MADVSLQQRGLPALTQETTTKAATTATKATASNDKPKSTQAAQTTEPVTNMPKLTSATTTETTATTATDIDNTASWYSSETTSYTTPVIELPSADRNPNVWRSNKPAGTVFIAVGAVSGLILLAIVIWFFINSWISYSQAKQLKKYSGVEKQFQNPFIDDIDFGVAKYADDDDMTSSTDDGVPRSKNNQKHSLSHYKKASHSMIRLLGGSTDEGFGSGTPYMPDNNGAMGLNALERTDAIDVSGSDLRKSLYISPTLEVMNQQRKSMLFSNLNQSTTSFEAMPVDDAAIGSTGPVLNKPGRTHSPERRTKIERNKSNLNKLVDDPIVDLSMHDNNDEQVNSKLHSRKMTPSMFLDNMLEDES